MGGRITRALYKNERQTHMRSSTRQGSQMRQLSVTFTLVMSSIASFLIGYLHRPYSLHSLADTQLKANTQSPSQGQKHSSAVPFPQSHSTDWQSLSLSLTTFIIIVLLYLLRKQHPLQSSLQHILRLTKISATVSGLLFIFDILSWVLSYEVKWIFATAYGLLWISFANICLLVFNNIKFVQHRKECKERQNKELQAQGNLDMVDVKRSMFLVLLVMLFEAGTKCSQYMRQLRVDKMVKEVLEGKQSKSNIDKLQEQVISGLYGIEKQYRQFILDSQHYEKLMLRVVFLFLVLMIGTTIVAFMKKSLYHFYLFEVKKNDYLNWYQREITPINYGQQQTKQSMKNSQQSMKNSQIVMNNNQFKNLSKRSIIMSTLLFIMGFILVESQVQRTRYQTKVAYTFENEVSFKSGSIFVGISLVVSFLLLKGFLVVKSCLMNISGSVNRGEQEQRKTKAIEIGGFWCIFMIVLVMSSLIGYMLQASPQQSEQQKEQNYLSKQEIGLYYLPVSIMVVSQILLTFTYLRFSKQQLWRYPQTSLQPYITLTVVVTYIVKYLLPYQLLNAFSENLINFTVLPILRGLKSILYMFMSQRGNSSINTQHILCTLILVYVIMVVLLRLNSHRTVSLVVGLISTKKQAHSHQVQEKSYSDSRSKLTSNLMLQEAIDQSEEASRLLK